MKKFVMRITSTLLAALILFTLGVPVSATETEPMPQPVSEAGEFVGPVGGLQKVEVIGMPEAQNDEEEAPISTFATAQANSLTSDGTEEAFDGSGLYFYNLMNDTQKELYQLYYYLMIDFSLADDRGYALDSSLGTVMVADMLAVTWACTFDNPEIYWCSASFSYGYSLAPGGSEDDQSTHIITALYKGDDTILNQPDTEAQALQKIQEMQDAADALLAGIEDGPPAVMAKEIHDALALHVAYDHPAATKGDPRSLEYLPHTAYNALTLGSAVCDGYSKAYKYLLKQRDINATVVTSEDHAWNVVELGNDLYEVDVTWDDPDTENYVFYTFFNRTTAAMETTCSIPGDPETRHPSREAGGANTLMAQATGTHFSYQYLNTDTAVMSGMAPAYPTGRQTMKAVLYKNDAYCALVSDPNAAAWSVRVVHEESGAYTDLSPIIWSLSVSIGSGSVIAQDGEWSETSPNIAFNRLASPTGPSSAFTVDIIFDNGARGSLAASLAATYATPDGNVYDADDTVDIKDAVYLKQALSSAAALTVLQRYKADLNSDGSVTAADLELLMKSIAAA